MKGGRWVGEICISSSRSRQLRSREVSYRLAWSMACLVSVIFFLFLNLGREGMVLVERDLRSGSITIW
jgi:hypothetical protein